jgi:hypothetical protein
MRWMMEKPGDNVFDLGSLFKAIVALSIERDKLDRYKAVQQNINKAIAQLKALLKAEVDKI